MLQLPCRLLLLVRIPIGLRNDQEAPRHNIRMISPRPPSLKAAVATAPLPMLLMLLTLLGMPGSAAAQATLRHRVRSPGHEHRRNPVVGLAADIASLPVVARRLVHDPHQRERAEQPVRRSSRRRYLRPQRRQHLRPLRRRDRRRHDADHRRRAHCIGEKMRSCVTASGAKVTFDQPGVAERTMYFGESPLWSGGGAAAGARRRSS